MSFYAKSYMYCFEHKSKMIKIKPRKYVYILLILRPGSYVVIRLPRRLFLKERNNVVL